MLTKSFGPNKIEVPVIGQGTWHMGDSRRQRDTEVEALRLGIELGMTHIDTAEMYGRGGAEEVIRIALQGTPRASVFLVSKVLPSNASYEGTKRAAEQSLRRLGTDYLDLYLLHWRESEPLQETMRAMEDLVAARMIRAIGVSNFEVSDLEEASAALRHQPLACNQVLYNLADRSIENELLPYCREHAIAVVGYTPFGGLPSPRSAGGRALSHVGARHRATPEQAALAFLTREEGVFAIPKASDKQHVRENAQAAEIVLDADDIALIDEAFPV